MEKYGVTELTTDEMMDISGGAIISRLCGYMLGEAIDLSGLALTYIVNLLPDGVASFLREMFKGASAS